MILLKLRSTMLQSLQEKLKKHSLGWSKSLHSFQYCHDPLKTDCICHLLKPENKDFQKLQDYFEIYNSENNKVFTTSFLRCFPITEFEIDHKYIT